MPLYEYKCDDCGKRMEILLNRSDEKPVCKYCESENLTRLLSSFNTSESNNGSGDISSCPTGTCNLG